MRGSTFISTQWPRNLLVHSLRYRNHGPSPCYTQLKRYGRVTRPNIPQRSESPRFWSLSRGTNASAEEWLPHSVSWQMRHFTVSTSLNAHRRVKIFPVSRFSRSRRLVGPTLRVLGRRRRLTYHPYYVARRKEFFTATRSRKRRESLKVLLSGKVKRSVVDTGSSQAKASLFNSASRRTFFDTLRSLQLNENANSDVTWAFINGNVRHLPPSWTELPLGERSLLLEAFYAHLEGRFFANPIAARSALNLLASRGLLDETEWVFCIALMAKPVYRTLHGIDEKPVEERLATMFDASIPLYVLMRAWESFLQRNLTSRLTPHGSAVYETEPSRLSPDTIQQPQQYDDQSYESRLLAQCGLGTHDMNGAIARRLITASLMTLSAMTSWLAQLRSDSRLDFSTAEGMGPNEGFNSQQQFNIRTMSQREFSFLRMVILAAKGSSANAIMLKAGLANVGLSPADTDLLATSQRELQAQSDALEARLRGASDLEGTRRGAAAHPHVRAANAIRYAIKQTADTGQLAKIRDITCTIHTAHPNFHLDSVILVLCRRYWALNEAERALDLWANNKYLQSSRVLVNLALAHYLDNNELENFEYICRLVQGNNQRIKNILCERYWQLAGPKRALRVWLDNSALHGSPLLLRRALQHCFDQKDVKNFEKAWHIGARRFRILPEDLQQRRMEILMSYGQPAIAEAAIRDRQYPQIRAGRLDGRSPKSTSVHFGKSTIGRILHVGKWEPTESYLRLLEPFEEANAGTYRLFMRHSLAARDLRASGRFAEKLYKKGELPDDTDASRYLLCSLENLRLSTKQPMATEIYYTIQTAFDFRYGTKFGEDTSQRPVRIQRQIGTARHEPGLRQEPAIDHEKRTPFSTGHTYLTLLQVILDEGFEWEPATGVANSHSKNSDKNNTSNHELRAGLQYIEQKKRSYTRLQRVRDALMLDNFRRRESSMVNTPAVRQNEHLLQAALITLPRREQLALLSGDHIAQGFTHGCEYHFIWDRFAPLFLMNHLQQFKSLSSALRAVHTMKMSSFGSITPQDLINAGINKSTARKKILQEAAILQYQLWTVKLDSVNKLVKKSAEAIVNSKLDFQDLQLWRKIATRLQKVIKYNGQDIDKAELEFETLKAGRIVDIAPYRPAVSLPFLWWSYRLRRTHHWLKNSARDFEQIEREWRDIKANPPRPVLRAPERELPEFLLYNPKVAPRRAQAMVIPRRVAGK